MLETEIKHLHLARKNLLLFGKHGALHEEKNVEEILKLAGDNIRIEGPGGELIIEGKENFKGFFNLMVQ